MRDTLTLAQLQHWLLIYAAHIGEHHSHLTALDAAIGDGDHGINLQRGMTALCARLTESPHLYANISSLLRLVATTMISTVGGTSGSLYGIFFLCAAAQPNPGDQIHLQELAHMCRAGLEGVGQRGKAQLGDKTMVDAMQPAVAALEAAAAQGAPLTTAAAAAAAAAARGVQQTIQLRARKGRASYLGVRSIGHQDPGATSTHYLFEALLQAAIAAAARGSGAIPDETQDGG